jgi:arylsulfatase A
MRFRITTTAERTAHFRWMGMALACSLLALTPPSATHGQEPAGTARRQPNAQRLPDAQRPPNFVIVFADDLGYADIGSFSTRDAKAKPRTPNLDRMAAEGIRLTSFYVAQAVCSASRAALLTGAYSNRVGITGALNHRATHGINPDEITLAEMLKARGYATAIYGKWHLGHEQPFLPRQHGFDEYFGLPYSNDMWPRHPQQKDFYPDLPLIDGNNVAELDPDQSRLTTRYTERAVSFIDRNRDKPFFLYLAHTMPHVPLFVSNKFKGKTGQGLYGDVVAEIDWSVGRVLDAIKRAKLDDNTLVIFTSDNGPWMSYGNHAGSRGEFRESKGTAFEGGVRVPFVARWPGRIPRGAVGSLPAMTIDLLPTFAKLSGAAVSEERIIDGRDIWPLLTNAPDAQAPHDALYFYWGTELHAVRSGRWKLHLAHPYRALERPGQDGSPGTFVQKTIEMSLFDLESDPGESIDVASRHPDVVAQLLKLAERARDDLGDSLTKRVGRNVRQPGRTGP